MSIILHPQHGEMLGPINSLFYSVDPIRDGTATVLWPVVGLP